MTRTELYDRVWQTPMRTLAKEFGVSDVAMANLCRKHSVPTPRVGHWMKVAAGKAPVRPRLPDVDGADEIEMPGGERTAQAQKGNRVARDRSVARPSDAFPPAGVVQLRASLAGCHPMIRATATFFEGMAREVALVEANRRRPSKPGQPMLGLMMPRSINGRFKPNTPGCLDVLISLEHVRWVMQFHDALFRELKQLRASVRPLEWGRQHSAEVVRGGYGLAIALTEGFSNSAIGRSLVSRIENPYSPADDYTLTLKRRIGKRAWRAPRAQLEMKIGTIAREIIDMIAEDAASAARYEREQQELAVRLELQAAEQRQLAAERARREFREATRRAQAGRALNVGRQQLEYEATLRVLADLEARCPADDEGTGFRTWLDVARAGLTPPVDALLAQLQHELATDGGPDWWPLPLGEAAP